MAKGQKKKIIELPVKLILTQEGTTFFMQRKKKPLKFKLAGNIEEYGISLEKFSPETLQRLLLTDYISKVEISESEFVSSRQEVMDLSKLIVYSLLYKQYDEFIFKQLINSPVIKKWNRQNPSSIIDEKTHINKKFITKMASQNSEMIKNTKREILEPLSSFIMRNNNLQPSEKNIQLFLSEKFLDNVRPIIWFIIIKFKMEGDFEFILKMLRTALVEYMDKTKIAEYIALMLMELIVNAENTNLRKEAQAIFPELSDPQEALLDSAIRKRLIAELELKKELVFVSWKLGGGTASIGAKGKIQITVYSKNEQSKAIRNSLNDLKNADINKNSLIDFYKNLPENEETNLGMYYISYLNDACEKVGVRFESGASMFENTDLTVMNMSFMF